MPTSYDAPGIPYNSHLGYNGLPPIVTPDYLPTLALQVTSKTGVVSPLPEANVQSMSFESTGAGAIQISVAEGTIGSGLVDDYSVVDLLINGQPVEDGRWLLRNKDWNAGRRNGIKTFTGKMLLWDRLEHTRIQDDKRYQYANKSPGFILNDIFTLAKARGALGPYFTWTFTAAVDSLGNAWPASSYATFEYLTGAKYNDIINNLLDREAIEIGLVGNAIRIYVAGKRGSTKGALLVVGEDVTDAPQKSTTEGIVSDVIVVGDEGVIVKRSNALTASVWGREEDAISQGGTKDIGTLSVIGDAALDQGTSPRVQRTYNMVIHQDKRFLPLRDYQVNDWINVEHGNGELMSLRIKQLVLSQAKGQWTGSLVLNDKFLENEIRLAKKVDGILGGASIVGSSQPPPDAVKDTGVPNVPLGLVLSFEQYTDQAGTTKAVMHGEWLSVTTNTDGSTATDLRQYRFVWWYADEDYETRQVLFCDDNQVNVSPVDTDRYVNAFVYLADEVWNFSGGSPVVVAYTGRDTIAPPQLSTPVLTSTLKTVTVGWDGLGAAAELMPYDWRHAEIWASPISTCPETVLAGILSSGGDIVIPAGDYEIDQIMYVKFVGVDKNGNRGVASAIQSVVVRGVTGDDMEYNSVTANAIAGGAVGAQHVNAGALDTARLSLGPTMNLVVDPSFALQEWRDARLTTQWAEKPNMWFFKYWEGRARNGFYLQALSDPVNFINGGRMYITDWIATQYGESYYVATWMRHGDFTANAEARLFLGWEATKFDGEVIGGGQTLGAPTFSWTRWGYTFPVADLTWSKIRFYVRADNLTAGDLIMDDWEVRSAVGTTAVAGPRITLTPAKFEAYNTAEQRTVLIDAETGDFFAIGGIYSGMSGKRVEVNPGTTYLPEIRFFPTTGGDYAYINAVDNGGGNYPFIAVNSPDAGISGGIMKIWDAGFTVGEVNKGTGVPWGPNVFGNGFGNSGFLELRGKMPGYADNLAFMYGASWDVGASVTGVTLLKPATPISGTFIPVATLQRTTGTAFQWHTYTNTAAQWQMQMQTSVTPTIVNYIVFRGDPT